MNNTTCDNHKLRRAVTTVGGRNLCSECLEASTETGATEIGGIHIIAVQGLDVPGIQRELVDPTMENNFMEASVNKPLSQLRAECPEFVNTLCNSVPMIAVVTQAMKCMGLSMHDPHAAGHILHLILAAYQVGKAESAVGLSSITPSAAELEKLFQKGER